MAEESWFPEFFFGQLIVGFEHGLKVGGSGHGPEERPFVWVGQVGVIPTWALAVMLEEVCAPKHEKTVGGGGDQEFPDDPISLIIAKRQDDLDECLDVHPPLQYYIDERDLRPEIQVSAVSVDDDTPAHLLDYPFEISRVRSCVEGHTDTGLVRHIVLLSGASACQ